MQLSMMISAAKDAELVFLANGQEGSDEYLAVQSCVEMGIRGEEIKAEILRFYEISKESLASVWPAVHAVAKYLIKQKQMDKAQFSSVIKGYDLYSPVFAIQKKFGILE